MEHVHGADSLKLVGHLPIELSFIINCFLQTHPNNFIIVEITGPRGLEICLVVPGKFTAFAKRAAKGRNTLNAHKRTLQARGSDLTEEKLFSCTDAAVVEA